MMIDNVEVHVLQEPAATSLAIVAVLCFNVGEQQTATSTGGADVKETTFFRQLLFRAECVLEWDDAILHGLDEHHIKLQPFAGVQSQDRQLVLERFGSCCRAAETGHLLQKLGSSAKMGRGRERALERLEGGDAAADLADPGGVEGVLGAVDEGVDDEAQALLERLAALQHCRQCCQVVMKMPAKECIWVPQHGIWFFPQGKGWIIQQGTGITHDWSCGIGQERILKKRIRSIMRLSLYGEGFEELRE